MAYEVPRSLVETFYKIYALRIIDQIAPYLHDDVEWTISGPIDLLPFCGTRHGKAAVIDLIARAVPRVLIPVSFVPETFLVQGDRAAMLSRKTAKRATDGHAVSYRVANFMRFRDDKLVANLSLIDTFDAVEQVLGHSLTASIMPGGGASELVAV
jgi:ketosteroid isomerase-like protein